MSDLYRVIRQLPRPDGSEDVIAEGLTEAEAAALVEEMDGDTSRPSETFLSIPE
jgi:hypothetical protein